MKTPNPITASREKIESDFMESEPIKRVLTIENLAIVTGRAREYHGKTIQEVLSQALLQHEAVVREEVIAIAKKIIGDKPCTPKCEECKAWIDLLRTTQPTI